MHLHAMAFFDTAGLFMRFSTTCELAGFTAYTNAFSPVPFLSLVLRAARCSRVSCIRLLGVNRGTATAFRPRNDPNRDGEGSSEFYQRPETYKQWQGFPRPYHYKIWISPGLCHGGWTDSLNRQTGS